MRTSLEMFPINRTNENLKKLNYPPIQRHIFLLRKIIDWMILIKREGVSIVTTVTEKRYARRNPVANLARDGTIYHKNNRWKYWVKDNFLNLFTNVLRQEIVNECFFRTIISSQTKQVWMIKWRSLCLQVHVGLTKLFCQHAWACFLQFYYFARLGPILPTIRVIRWQPY